ncbi:WD40 repeat-like-containing domain protein [Akanthomyces lecanii RCEF 1005]|uniref:WD40 repeat-like-containing domain protein n=1 Tax=Akanthomyces lecanii RCEF 1005 TaxID=1081108 RepID=A0A162MV90_CORDF|nr:WD40 repeat-like-containing domain protein [Akanthomyces lecanii RCEF 1005]
MESSQKALEILQNEWTREVAEYRHRLRIHATAIRDLLSRLARNQSRRPTVRVENDNSVSAEHRHRRPDGGSSGATDSLAELDKLLREESGDSASTEHRNQRPDRENNSAANVPANWHDMCFLGALADDTQSGSSWTAFYSAHVPRQLSITHQFGLKHDAILSCMRFSPDGRYLATASQQTVRIYNLEDIIAPFKTLEEKRTHSAEVTLITCLCFSPDGKILVTGSEDKVVRMWDIENEEICRTMSAHPAAVVSVCYGDEATILSGSRDGTVNVWQLMSISPVFTLKASDGSKDRSLRIWDVSTGEQQIVLLGMENSVVSMATSENRFALNNGDNIARVWSYHLV